MFLFCLVFALSLYGFLVPQEKEGYFVTLSLYVAYTLGVTL